jgi:hypothetical protein
LLLFLIGFFFFIVIFPLKTLPFERRWTTPR